MGIFSSVKKGFSSAIKGAGNAIGKVGSTALDIGKGLLGIGGEGGIKLDLGSLAGTAINGGMAFMGTKEDREFAAKQAQLNRDWQQAMANGASQFNANMADTSIQRRVADMQNAGLNPMLMMGGASAGAAATSGSSPAGSQAAVSYAMPAIIGAITDAKNGAAQRKLVEAEIQKTKKEADAIGESTLTETVRREGMKLDNALRKENILTAPVERRLKQAQTIYEKEKIITEAINRASISARTKGELIKQKDMLFELGVKSMDPARTPRGLYETHLANMNSNTTRTVTNLLRKNYSPIIDAFSGEDSMQKGYEKYFDTRNKKKELINKINGRRGRR